MLTDVNVKNKCTCVDVERFKDMFANSKRLLAVATTACRPGFYSQPSICLLFLSFLFCYADSSWGGGGGELIIFSDGGVPL